MFENWIDIVVPIVTTLLGVSLTYYFTRRVHKKKSKESEAKEKLMANELALKNRLAFYREMRIQLHASHDAFIDQCRLRNKLLVLLGHDLHTFDWEELENVLAEAYPNLDTEQKDLFNFIRGITENSLFPRNEDIKNLLLLRKEYFKELPKFEKLLDHLALWLAKYESHLKKREDYCIIYVGVKEGKPFPSGIEDEVDEAIAKMETTPLSQP